MPRRSRLVSQPPAEPTRHPAPFLRRASVPIPVVSSSSSASPPPTSIPTSPPTSTHPKPPTSHRPFMQVRVADFVTSSPIRHSPPHNALGPVDATQRPPCYNLLSPTRSRPLSHPSSHPSQFNPNIAEVITIPERHVGVQVRPPSPSSNAHAEDDVFIIRDTDHVDRLVSIVTTPPSEHVTKQRQHMQLKPHPQKNYHPSLTKPITPNKLHESVDRRSIEAVSTSFTTDVSSTSSLSRLPSSIDSDAMHAVALDLSDTEDDLDDTDAADTSTLFSALSFDESPRELVAVPPPQHPSLCHPDTHDRPPTQLPQQPRSISSSSYPPSPLRPCALMSHPSPPPVLRPRASASHPPPPSQQTTSRPRAMRAVYGPMSQPSGPLRKLSNRPTPSFQRKLSNNPTPPPFPKLSIYPSPPQLPPLPPRREQSGSERDTDRSTESLSDWMSDPSIFVRVQSMQTLEDGRAPTPPAPPSVQLVRRPVGLPAFLQRAVPRPVKYTFKPVIRRGEEPWPGEGMSATNRPLRKAYPQRVTGLRSDNAQKGDRTEEKSAPEEEGPSFAAVKRVVDAIDPRMALEMAGGPIPVATARIFRRGSAQKRTSDESNCSTATEYYEDEYTKFIEKKATSPLKMLAHPHFPRLMSSEGRLRGVGRMECRSNSTISMSTSDEEYSPVPYTR